MDDDDQLTADDIAALDAQRGAPEPEAPQDAPETPQEGAGAPEAPEGTEDPAPEADKRPQMVPHAALHEERKRRQETERQAAEDRRKYEARFEELLKLVPQPQQAPAEQAPAIPDVQADPVGHIVGTLQQLGASQEQIRQAVATQQTQAQQQQLRDAVIQRSTAMEADYAAKNPEYNNAVQYLRDFRSRQLAAFGMDAPQIAQQIAAETLQIAASELQRGGNPAERLHRLAEASGWSAGAAAQPGQTGQAVPDQATRLRMAQQGQEHSRGLGNVRGNGPSPMTAAKLLDMDDDAFLEAMKKSKDARKLMGA
jgi:hypothetical protein